MKDSDFIGKKFNLKKTSQVISGKFIGSMELVVYELDDSEMTQQLKRSLWRKCQNHWS